MPKKSTISQLKYDNEHCRTYHMKLHLENDADIIEKLASVPSMQGYIKRLIREDIARTYPESVPKTPFATPEIDERAKEQIRKQLQSVPKTEKE